MWASEQDVPFQFTSIKPCEDTRGGFISLIAAVAASEEFGWPRTRTFLPENTSPPPGQPTLIVCNILRTTQLVLQSIQQWIKLTIASREAKFCAKKISSGKIPPLGSFAAKARPLGFMTSSMPHVHLTAIGKTWEEMWVWWLPLNLLFVLIHKRERAQVSHPSRTISTGHQVSFISNVVGGNWWWDKKAVPTGVNFLSHPQAAKKSKQTKKSEDVREEGRITLFVSQTDFHCTFLSTGIIDGQPNAPVKTPLCDKEPWNEQEPNYQFQRKIFLGGERWALAPLGLTLELQKSKDE